MKYVSNEQGCFTYINVYTYDINLINQKKKRKKIESQIWMQYQNLLIHWLGTGIEGDSKRIEIKLYIEKGILLKNIFL